MIKLVHKKHMQKGSHGTKLVIYYSVSDIVLGILLLVLTGFFIYNYVGNSLGWKNGQSQQLYTPGPSL
jgi:hypothetical protein